MDILIYIQRSFGFYLFFVNSLSPPFIARRHYREFVDIPFSQISYKKITYVVADIPHLVYFESDMFTCGLCQQKSFRMHAVTAKKGCVRTSENPIHRVSLFSFWLNLNNSKLSFTVVVDLALRSFVRHNHGTPQWVGITSICSELVFCECNQGFLQIIELLQDSDSI